jgi:molybdenum cofactor cytidylyltransferase
MIQLAAVTMEESIEFEVAAVVLAAGSATRMGQFKQLLPVGGLPMVRRVTEAVCAAGLAQVVVVTGARAGDVQEVLVGLPVDMVVNEAWAGGLSTSVRAGLQALRPDIRASLMVLADQPALTPGLLRALVARFRATEAPLVVPCYQGRRGNPVLVARSLFAELMAVEGDRAGRVLLARHENELQLLEVGDPAVIADVDTPEEYDKLTRNGNRS